MDVAGDICSTLALAPPNLDFRSESITSALKRVAIEMTCPGFASKTLVDALITGVSVDLVRFCRDSTPRRKPLRGGLAGWQLRRINEVLRELERAAPTVPMLAELIGISPRHLVRALRQSTGTTVVSYIAKVRHARACELLATTELPLKQIAYKSGFSTPSSFTAAFRREAGESPSNYRLRHKLCRSG